MKDFNGAPGMVEDENAPRGYTIENGSTIIDEHLHKDLISSIQKILVATGENPNSVFDSETTGYQLLTSIIKFIAGAPSAINNKNKIWYRKKIGIGIWDMNTDLGVTINHGLSAGEVANIVSASVIIRRDTSPSSLFPLNLFDVSFGADMAGGITSIDSTSITLEIKPNCFFNQDAGFNDNTINRGYIWLEIYNYFGDVEAQ